MTPIQEQIDTLIRGLKQQEGMSGVRFLREYGREDIETPVSGFSAVVGVLKTEQAQSFLGEYAHDYGALMAFSMAGSLPIVLLFIFFQKYMISGLTAGAVKG